jgi:copper homeostasis protein (lipoprotein)
MLRIPAGAITALMLILGPGSPASAELVARNSSDSIGLAGGDPPASFSGTLPCEDCPGIRHWLNLLPDKVFHLRTRPLNESDVEGESSDEIGIWDLSADGDTLILHPTLGRPSKLLIETPSVLNLIEKRGSEVQSEQPHELYRTEYRSIEPRLFLRGKYAKIEDGGVFRECVTGRRLLVADEGENAQLEEEYLRFRKQYGDDLLVSLQGRITRQERSNGSGHQEILIVERMGHFWPAEVCGRWVSLATLKDSYWYLMRLRGKPVITPITEHEPYMRLASESYKVDGFGGCSSFGGEFELEGENLRFNAIRMGERVCPEGKEQQEVFADVLEATARWRIRSGLLELYDIDGALIAWFEPRYTRL